MVQGAQTKNERPAPGTADNWRNRSIYFEQPLIIASVFSNNAHFQIFNET
jgi:hypothetical protein